MTIDRAATCAQRLARAPLSHSLRAELEATTTGLWERTIYILFFAVIQGRVLKAPVDVLRAPCAVITKSPDCRPLPSTQRPAHPAQLTAARRRQRFPPITSPRSVLLLTITTTVTRTFYNLLDCLVGCGATVVLKLFAAP